MKPDSSKSLVIQDGMSSAEPSTGHFEGLTNSFASGINLKITLATLY